MKSSDKVELLERAHRFQRLVQALAGLGDNQIAGLLAHFSNAALPDGERNEELMTELLDARRASLVYVSPLQKQVNAVLALTAESHATTSRDYGRGFAECLRIVHSLLRGEP